VTAIFYNLLWQVAAWHDRLIVPGAESLAAEVSRRYWWGSPSYIVATLVALVSVPGSLAIDAGLALLYVLPRRDRRGDGRREQALR